MRSAAPPPPIAVIDWWLSKCPEERRAFLAAENTSDNVRANIAAVEAYCLSNPYAVFRDTSLRPRPLAPRLLLPTPTGVANREAFPHLPLVCAAPGIDIGARSPHNETQKRQLQEAAATHLSVVAERVKQVLGTGNSNDKAAEMMVRVLAEAMSAALHRTGVVAAIEAHERAALAASQAPQGRNTTLALQRPKAETSAPQADPRDAKGARRAAAVGSSAATTGMRARPIAACANRAIGLLALASALATVSEAAVAKGGKRAREEAEALEQEEEEPAAEAPCGQRNPWAAVRTALSEALPPVEVESPEQTVSPNSPGGKDAPNGVVPSVVEITGKDMALALLKVSSLPEYRDLLPSSVPF